jgi:hypothetical protein
LDALGYGWATIRMVGEPGEVSWMSLHSVWADMLAWKDSMWCKVRRCLCRAADTHFL